jgi:hypothetical protein
VSLFALNANDHGVQLISRSKTVIFRSPDNYDRRRRPFEKVGQEKWQRKNGKEKAVSDDSAFVSGPRQILT